jgi:hypothetical protein
VSRKNAPPVVNAQVEAGVANAASLFVPILGSTDDEEFTNNYEMLSGKNDQYTLLELLVDNCSGAILPGVHWTAYNAVHSFPCWFGSQQNIENNIARHEGCWLLGAVLQFH